jgi:hypothetical protein
MSRVEIPVEAKLNAGDIDAELKQLTQKINALGQAIAKANQVKFNPISKASLDDVKRMNDQFERLKRTSQLGQDLNRTGQGSKSFVDLDWNAVATNSITREARRYGAFNRVIAGTGASFTQAAPSPGGGGGGGSGGGSGGGGRPSPGAGGSPWRNAGRNIVGAGLNAAGPVGGVVNTAISAGSSGGAMAGVAGLLGGIVALGVGKLVGGVMSKIGDAQQDSIGYDTLKRSLGVVNVSFSVLQRSMHAASDAFDGTYQQTLKMGGEFARISGMSGKGSNSLANEVAIGGGFGRSFGVDPEQSNAFFAQMRQFSVTGNDKDSQRLAVYVGEAIAKSGSFAKTDEMLQAIASYTSQQTRMGLASANVGDYTAMLTGMVGSHAPGMDPMGAAGLLSRVNGSIASGGNAGEAGQNFMYMAVGRQLGLSPIMGAALREQGAFGTGQQEFGPTSVMGQWASANGVNIPTGAAGSNATTMSMIMSRLHSTYANNPELRLSAMQNLFGTNINQSAFLDMMKPTQMGDVMSKLTNAGIDTSKMNPAAISSLAQVAVGSRSDMNDATHQIWGKLSPDEQGSLNKAQAGGDESLRNELLKDFAKYGQGDTEGSQTRKSINDLDKDLMDVAGKMIAPLNTMRDLLTLAFGKRGAMTATDIHNQVLEAQKQDVNDRADTRIDAARKELLGAGASYGGGGLDASIGSNSYKTAYANLQSETGGANWDRWDQLKKIYDDDYAEQHAFDKKKDSNLPSPPWGNAGAGSGASPGGGGTYDPIGGSDGKGGTRSSRNNNPGNIEFNAWSRAHGATGTDGRFAVFPSAQVGTAAMGDLLNSYATNDHLNTVTGIISKWSPSSDGNNTAAYIADVSKKLGVDPNATLQMSDPKFRETFGRAIAGHEGNASAYQTGTPMPDTGSSASTSAGAGGMQSYSFDHNITLYHPNGQQAAPPFSINTNVAAPAPFGI